MPRPYQERGIEVCLHQACAGLLLDPGLGKTTIMYAVIKILKELGYVKKVLVVAPLKVAHNVWPTQKNEWEQFKDLTVSVLHGPKKEERLNDDSLIHVINPEGLNWLIGATWSGKNAIKKGGKVQVSEERLRHVKDTYDMLVVDESTKFKHTGTNRFAVLRQFVAAFRRRYILTGTISPNGLHDLFGQIYILDEGASLGQYVTHYRNKYFTPDPYIKGVWHPTDTARDRIAEKIAPLVLRMRREDWLQMPELIFDDRYVDLPPEVMAQYKVMEKELLALVENKMVIAANTAVASSKCRQIANGALYTGSEKEYVKLHTAKLDELENLIDEMQGQSLLIPYTFQFDREMIQERLKIPCIGQGSDAKDAVLINQFNSGLCPNLLGHPETISLGLNLQGNCYHVVWYGLPWNLEHYLQTIDRVYRQGQRSRRVIVHRILARGTLDERMPLVLGKKGADMNDFMALLQSIRQ
jgi:SNF2 family DNA or RNA helicase